MQLIRKSWSLKIIFGISITCMYTIASASIGLTYHTNILHTFSTYVELSEIDFNLIEDLNNHVEIFHNVITKIQD